MLGVIARHAGNGDKGTTRDDSHPGRIEGGVKRLQNENAGRAESTF